MLAHHNVPRKQRNLTGDQGRSSGEHEHARHLYAGRVPHAVSLVLPKHLPRLDDAVDAGRQQHQSKADFFFPVLPCFFRLAFVALCYPTRTSTLGQGSLLAASLAQRQSTAADTAVAFLLSNYELVFEQLVLRRGDTNSRASYTDAA